MCNAFNHPKSCRCGWGGDGHQGQPSLHWDDAWSKRLPNTPWHVSIEDFCRKTTCPICGSDNVYFVRHNGGSVWFDQLGLPWPKHGCFDTQATQSILDPNPINTKVPEGWHRHPNGGGLVQDTAVVADTAFVGAEATVSGNAQVLNNARVYGRAQIYGNGQVLDSAEVYDDAQVLGNAMILVNSRVGGNSKIFGNTRIFGASKGHW